MKRIKLSLLLALTLLPMHAMANEWVNDTQIVQMGAYQHSPGHFVWLSSGVVSECQQVAPANPSLHFSDDSAGGKAMLAIIMTALVTKATVNVQVDGCDIVEVYLK